MDDAILELGVTDYLHEIEVWQQRLKQWELDLPWPDGAAAALCVDSLLHLASDLTSLCLLLREQNDHPSAVARRGSDPSLREVETQLGLTIWRIMREEERLAEILPLCGGPKPLGLPRARLMVGRS